MTYNHQSDPPPDYLQTTVFLHRRIRSSEDQTILQKDLDSLQQWEDWWLMASNPYKCKVEQNTKDHH
jgi:hypothetical protein